MAKYSQWNCNFNWCDGTMLPRTTSIKTFMTEQNPKLKRLSNILTFAFRFYSLRLAISGHDI